MDNRLLASELIIEYFRAFKKVNISLASNLTVISGPNGCGKSSLLSLVASCSGINKKSFFGSNFQPEFTDFFHIDATEDFKNYRLFIRYNTHPDSDALVKRLSFKDDSASGRGIRIIPRTTNEYSVWGTVSEAMSVAYDRYCVGGSARIPLPTIYLSLSRLYPLGEKHGESSVQIPSKGNRISQIDVKDKFREWYNSVIPNSIKESASISIIKKTACSRMSAHMDMDNIPSLSQSVGQDSVGNIISALIDIYLLSLEKWYKGAILCIDELDVSLHPDTQIKLLHLIKKLSDELKIQFVVSSHSLTVIKDILTEEKDNKDKYRLVYLKNSSSPYVSSQKDYYLLKYDLFNRFAYNPIKVRIYFEDDVGKELFNELLDAFIDIYNEVSSNENASILRNTNPKKNFIDINKRILNNKQLIQIKRQLHQVVTHCGCDELLQLSNADTLLDRVIFMLDADARLPKTQQPKIKDYIRKDFEAKGMNDISHKRNIIFAPGYFAPESFLFKIITKFVSDDDYVDFWRSLDNRVETSLYTSDKVLNIFSCLTDNYDNNDLKSIFGKDLNSDVWLFIQKTRILNYYYFDYRHIEELLSFVESLNDAFQMTYALTKANRLS